jgi:hypothetical protein
MQGREPESGVSAAGAFPFRAHETSDIRREVPQIRVRRAFLPPTTQAAGALARTL